MTGKFIVLEGIDASGTTTHTDLLVKWFDTLGVDAVKTCEPSHNIVGRFVRDLIDSDAGLTPNAVALLFAADREQHVHAAADGIVSRVSEGTWVVSDRYLLSSLAYQTADGVSIEDVLAYNRTAPDPDLTIFLDVPLAVSAQRLSYRRKTNRFEAPEMLNRTVDAYSELRRQNRAIGKLIVVDANRSVDVVQKEIRLLVASEFGLEAL